MLTKDEAISFVHNFLGILDVEKKLANERKTLLDEIVVLIQQKIPFQSVTLMATPPNERRRPSLEQIKEDCLTGTGGVCYTLNGFAWGLLRGLGFSTQLYVATVTGTMTYPNNHLLVLVRGVLEDGDRYLVDCGCGFPTFSAVPLDFDSESPLYRNAFLEYKFVHHDGKILRMHGEGDTLKRNDPPIDGLDFFWGSYRRFYFFVPAPTDHLSDLDSFFDDVYTNLDSMPFHRSPRAVYFPGQHAVIMVNNRLMMEGKNGKLETTDLKSDGEIIKNYIQYFPALKQETVSSAIKEWRNAGQ